jgi:CRP/FNR family transcriptional regulator
MGGVLGMQIDGNDPFRFLKSLSLFSKVPVRDLEGLAYSCQFGTIEAGEYFFMEGEEEPYSSFVVVSGRVAMLKSSLSGKELIVHLLESTDVFSLLLLLEGEGQPAQLSARAMSTTTVLWVPVAQFRSVINGHPGLFRELMAHLLSTLQTSYRLCLGLAHDHVDVRIATALSMLAQKIGKSNGIGSSGAGREYTVNLTRQQLADLTGTTSETAIRVTRAMHKQGLLDICRPGVIRIPSLKLLEEVAQGWT